MSLTPFFFGLTRFFFARYYSGCNWADTTATKARLEARTNETEYLNTGNRHTRVEKELGISLFEKVKEFTTPHQSHKGMTLGDFIKRE